MHPRPSSASGPASPSLRVLRARGEGPEKPSEDLLRELLEALDGGAGRGRIRCPRCAWRPRETDRWSCHCGHAWNTFDTRGECPGCGFRWRLTQCLACYAFSPHEDWYPAEPPRTA